MIIVAPVAWVQGPPSLWDHEGPRSMGTESSFALGPLRPPPHGCGGVSRFMIIDAPAAMGARPPRFGATEAPAAWAWRPPPLSDHQGLCWPHGCVALLRFWTTNAPAAWARCKMFLPAFSSPVSHTSCAVTASHVFRMDLLLVPCISSTARARCLIRGTSVAVIGVTKWAFCWYTPL